MRHLGILLSALAVGVGASLGAHPAAADDTVVTIGSGDRFVVKDASGVERLILDGTTGVLSTPSGIAATLKVDNTDGAKNFPAMLLVGNVDSGNEKHPLALVRADIGAGSRVVWLWKGGGGLITPASLKIDGRVRVDYDTTTSQIQVLNDPTFPDPDSPGKIPSMLLIGADVEFGAVFRPNHIGCTNCSPARTKPKAFIVIDYGDDWAFELEYDGRMRWGDAGASPYSDGDKGEASFDTGLYRVEDGADETMEFELDGDGDGNGTRRVAIAYPHPQGTGSTGLGGVMVWGNTGVAAIDSGDEVCTSVTGGTGLACQTTLDPTDGSEHSCSSPHPALEATASGLFHALCY